MPKVTYIGPHLAVRLAWPEGGEVEVERGQTVDTTVEHAEQLLEQTSNWQKPATKPAKAVKEEVR